MTPFIYWYLIIFFQTLRQFSITFILNREDKQIIRHFQYKYISRPFLTKEVTVEWKFQFENFRQIQSLQSKSNTRHIIIIIRNLVSFKMFIFLPPKTKLYLKTCWWKNAKTFKNTRMTISMNLVHGKSGLLLFYQLSLSLESLSMGMWRI